LLKLGPGWYAGFLSHLELGSFDFKGWVPDEPVIMVIDDAAAVPAKRLQAVIERFTGADSALQHPVRVLLLERAVDGQSWWDELLAKGQDSYADRVRNLHTGKPLALGRLDRDQQRAALERFLHATPQGAPAVLPADDDE